LSIGGATLSKSFPAIAADSAKRQKFVESSVKLLADIGFDGLGKYKHKSKLRVSIHLCMLLLCVFRY
jgi:hypothetical protein